MEQYYDTVRISNTIFAGVEVLPLERPPPPTEIALWPLLLPPPPERTTNQAPNEPPLPPPPGNFVRPPPERTTKRKRRRTKDGDRERHSFEDLVEQAASAMTAAEIIRELGILDNINRIESARRGILAH